MSRTPEVTYNVIRRLVMAAKVNCGSRSTVFFVVFTIFTSFFDICLCVSKLDADVGNHLKDPSGSKSFDWRDYDRPVQLVKPDEEHKKLVVNEENVKLLSQIKGAVATVAVVGKYHSGKSFLMNQLMRKSAGFGIGPTIEPQTMGIWMWGKPLEIKDRATGQTFAVVFLDTEGFTANNVSETYDAKIFAVGTLLSSYLIYNSVKIIDQSDIEYLELLARRTRLFALRSQLSKGKWTSDFNRDLLSFPPLLWVVQDFVQSTDDLNPTEWLHRMMSSHVRENEEYEISLLRIFDRVDCRTLFIPSADKRLLIDLSKANERDLTRDYRDERDELINTLFTNLRPKEKNHKYITGPELAMLLEILVSAANDGSLNDVPTRWNSFIGRLQETATEDCVNFYDVEMETLQQKYEGNPINPSELDEWHSNVSINAQKLLDHLLFGLNDANEKSKENLLAAINYKYETKKDLNMKRIHMKCSDERHRNELDLELSLSRLSLPEKTADLKNTIDGLVESALREFILSVSSFTEGALLESCIGQLKKSLIKLGEGILLKNHKLVESLLKDATKVASNKFNELSKNPKDGPRVPTNLNLLLVESQRVSLNEFDRLTKMVEGETVYEPFRALLLNQLKQAAEERHDENKQLAKAMALKMAKSVLEEIKERTSESKIRLPMNAPELEERLSVEFKMAEQRYSELTGDFRTYDSTVDTYDILLKELEVLAALRRQENVEAYTREVKGPLKIAKRTILLMADAHSTSFSLRKYIVQVCILHLDEGLAKSWSTDLKQQIVDHFIETDQELQQKLKERRGVWSSVVGFFQWLLYVLSITS